MGRRKKHTNIWPKEWGNRRVDELIKLSQQNGTFTPPSITLEDIDLAVFESFELNQTDRPNGRSLQVTLPGDTKPVSVISLQNKEMIEYIRTWNRKNDEGILELPFITFKRIDLQYATSDLTRYNFEGYHEIIKVPRFDGQNLFCDIYSIPQPTQVDIKYEIRFYCRHREDLNYFDENLLNNMDVRQYYLYPKNWPMPMILESISDNSQFNAGPDDRFFSNIYTFLVKGQIRNSDDFKLQESIKVVTVNVNVNV